MVAHIEKAIFKACIEELLASETYFHLGVNDGEDTVVQLSRNVDDLLHAAFSTDEDYLLVYLDITRETAGRKPHSGWIHFIYGNDGYDVIANYTSWLEPYIAKTEALASKIETGEVVIPKTEPAL